MAHRLRLEVQQHSVGEKRSVPKPLEHLMEGQDEEHSMGDHHGSNLGEEAQMMTQGDRRVRHSALRNADRNCPGGRHNPWKLGDYPEPASWWLRASLRVRLAAVHVSLRMWARYTGAGERDGKGRAGEYNGYLRGRKAKRVLHVVQRPL